MDKGYAICFNKWALDNSIKNELNLLLVISSLCAREGYCFASNKYLAELFNITEQSVSNKIKKLEDKGYIIIEYQRRGCEIISRKIRLKNIYIDDIKNFIPTIEKNFKDNNTSNNNTSNNNIYIETRHKYGSNGRVLLTDKQYEKLVNDYGEDIIKEKIELLDEYLQMNNNKNKYKDFNAVLRKAIREKWWSKQTYKKQNTEPEWLGKDIRKEEISDEAKRIAKYIRGED